MSDRVDELIQRLQAMSPLPDDGQLTDADIERYQEILSQLAESLDPRCIRPIVYSFGYGEASGAYWSAIHLLERFPADQVDPVLMEAIRSVNAGVCVWAAYMLGRSRNASSTPGLLKLLESQFPLVRLHAVMALGMIGDSTTRPHIERLKHDPSPEVREEVEAALENLG